MSNKPNSRKITKNSTIHWPTVILIGAVVILLIPMITLGLVFLDAFEGTGSALYGNRFANEMQEKITSEQIEQLQTDIKTVNSVNKVNVDLKSATLRVNALIGNDVSVENATLTAQSIMDKVLSVLPRETYFMNNASSKQYDLEVHVFNDRLSVEEGSYVYVIGLLNATMEESSFQVVSKPLDPEFVADLYQSILDKNNPDDGTDETPVEDPGVPVDNDAADGE